MKAAINAPEPIPEYLADLNDAQYEAVSTLDGPLLVFAGAGSGKTRVLTRRISHLIAEKRAHPGQILAVTFTNKAANEMRERVLSLLRRPAERMWVATFHSACVRILRAHARELDFTPQFAIYDSSDSLSLMRRVFKHRKIDPKYLDPKTVLHFIDRAKNSFRDPETVRNDSASADPRFEMMVELYAAYQKALHQANAMDFGDLLCNTVSLFRLEKSILAHYRELFRYVLVDEYQDTNHVQYLLLHAISSGHQNLCVVGDDDQSIYSFRGASLQNISRFRQDYLGAKVVTLNVNYRSTKRILRASSAVIARNSNRQAKSLETPNAEGEPINSLAFYSEHEEADFVLREVERLKQQQYAGNQIAIFYRTNAQSRSIEELLCEQGVPYVIFGGLRFYERKEIKDVLAYLRLVLNPKDDDSFLRAINAPTRGLGPTTVARIIEFASAESVSLHEATLRIIESGKGNLSRGVIKKLEGFLNLLGELREIAAQTETLLSEPDDAISRFDSIAELIRKIAEKSDYLPRLRQDNTPEAESRIENIYELIAVARDFVERQHSAGSPLTIRDFLDRASLNSDLDNSEASPNELPISLLTLHLAKGLEFDAVFMIGLEEGLLPHSRSLHSQEDLEEERRLCYVGMTRARKRLYLTRALSRRTYARGYGGYSGIASRFLNDLPDDVNQTSMLT